MQTVIGLFDTASEAQQAVEKLKDNGFTADNIDMSANNNYNDVRGNSTTGYASDNKSMVDNYNGITGTANTSEIGDSSNEFITTTSGANVAKDNEGFGNKVSSFFKNLFGDENDDANLYSHVASKAGSIVTVHAQSEEEAEEASDILDECGAVDMDERASQYGFSGNNYSGGDNASLTANNNSDDTLKVIKEDVQVGKREIETGGVRIKSRIVDRPVEQQLRLREETVTVQRTPVDRIATDADLQNFKDGEIEMTEHAEIANVSKQARVVEEIKLSKEVNEQVHTVHETARDTEVDVENLEKDKTAKKVKGKNL